MSKDLIWKDKNGIVKCDTDRIKLGTILELDGEKYYVAKSKEDAFVQVILKI